jgi:hypothetical protein
LASFVDNPAKHIKHAVKVLVKFRLLEVQSVKMPSLVAWAQATPYFPMVFKTHFAGQEFAPWIAGLVDELVKVGAASREGEWVKNA